ncbi:hypothetical protein M0804_009137 [Polistes exclamans]|nr:hypothetical protein M0804_009137 [Polistes exclamans]
MLLEALKRGNEVSTGALPSATTTTTTMVVVVVVARWKRETGGGTCQKDEEENQRNGEEGDGKGMDRMIPGVFGVWFVRDVLFASLLACLLAGFCAMDKRLRIGTSKRVQTSKTFFNGTQQTVAHSAFEGGVLGGGGGAFVVHSRGLIMNEQQQQQQHQHQHQHPCTNC